MLAKSWFNSKCHTLLPNLYSVHPPCATCANCSAASTCTTLAAHTVIVVLTPTCLPGYSPLSFLFLMAFCLQGGSQVKLINLWWLMVR